MEKRQTDFNLRKKIAVIVTYDSRHTGDKALMKILPQKLCWFRHYSSSQRFFSEKLKKPTMEIMFAKFISVFSVLHGIRRSWWRSTKPHRAESICECSAGLLQLFCHDRLQIFCSPECGWIFSGGTSDPTRKNIFSSLFSCVVLELELGRANLLFMLLNFSSKFSTAINF